MTTTSPTIPWTTDNRTALRTRRDDVSSLPAALRSEWIKLASLRANKVIFALTPVVGALIAWALASSATEEEPDRVRAVHLPAPAHRHAGHRRRDPHVHR